VKIRAIPARKLRSLLLKIGFEEEAGKDHVFFYFRYIGRIVVGTKISHGAKEIDQPVFGANGETTEAQEEKFREIPTGRAFT